MTVLAERDQDTGTAALLVYGRLAVRNLANRTFSVGTLSRIFVAPDETRLAAFDGLHVRVQVDGGGQVVAVGVPWETSIAAD